MSEECFGRSRNQGREGGTFRWWSGRSDGPVSSWQNPRGLGEWSRRQGNDLLRHREPGSLGEAGWASELERICCQIPRQLLARGRGQLELGWRQVWRQGQAWTWPAAVATAAMLCQPMVAHAQNPVPGPEFRVNVNTVGGQQSPSVAMDADGDFVVVWESYGQDGDGWGIHARRYDRHGDPAGGEFQVNTHTTASQSNPSVAMDADGDFVVAWDDNGWDLVTYYDDVYARRYDKNGAAIGDEFKVNTYGTNSQIYSSVAMDADGDFVITWQSWGQDGARYEVYARRYHANGATAGGEFRVNTYTTDDQKEPSVAMDMIGDFVVAWESYGQDGDHYGVYAQRYDANGTTAGGEFRVNTHVPHYQQKPNVTMMDPDGDYVIAWDSWGQDTSNTYGVYAQRYHPSGTPAGSEFPVNGHPGYYQRRPSVAINANGGFVVAWESYDDQDGSMVGVFARRYDPNGSAVGSEAQVNVHTMLNQESPSVAMDAVGDFVVVWHSYAQDGSDNGVYARRYAVPRQPTFLPIIVKDL